MADIFNEIDDDLRHDRYRKLWDRYGVIVLIAAAALVLGVAANGGPGPLVTHFTGAEAANLPCPLMLIPGSLDREALDRLS